MRHRTVRSLTRVVAAAALCAALVVALPLPAVALDTSTRPASAIAARWNELKPAYSGTPYAVAPSTSAPYAAGSLAAGFLQDGLNTINYARFLAGLPDDVVLDATYTSRAQHGAVLLAASTFSHTPPKPADMPQAFYDIGSGATGSSNVGMGHSSLVQFNSDCLDDGDTLNIDRVGHRRWLLNPPLKKTGMGYAEAFSDTLVFDWSRVETVDYDAVKWPCAGYFPVEAFGTYAPWSITLNPARYSWTAGRAGHTVTLRRARDGRTWTFTSADTNKSGKYFNFETSGFGVANCFIFRPDAATLGSYQAGDIFDVTLSGGITSRSTGQPVTISYRTEFMSQTDPPEPDITAPVTTSDAVAGYVGLAFVRFTATDTESPVAATYFSLDGGAVTRGTWVSVTATGSHELEFWSTDAAGNVEDRNSATFTISPGAAVRVATGISIAARPTVLNRYRTLSLYGTLWPGRMGDRCKVYMKRPGSSRWWYLSPRYTYTTSQAGGAAWRCSYRPRLRGYHYFRVIFTGDAGRASATSRTVRVRVR